jgi:hypothetical protein
MIDQWDDDILQIWLDYEKELNPDIVYNKGEQIVMEFEDGEK